VPLNAGQKSRLTADVAELFSLVNALQADAAPAPPAPSPPAPTPPAPAPSPTAAPTLQVQEINWGRCVIFDKWGPGSNTYERYQESLIVPLVDAVVGFHGQTYSPAGSKQALLQSQYTLLCDGDVIATATIAAGATDGQFQFSPSALGLAPGWHQIDIGGLHPTETSPRWAMHVGLEGVVGDDTPVSTGTFDGPHIAGKHFFAMIPAGWAPRAVPLVPRECPEFSTALPKEQMYRANLVPGREGNIHRVNVDANGVRSTCNKQAYFWFDLVKKYPPLSLLDGPRGVGTLMMPTALLVTRQGGAYFADPWRVGRVTPDGTVITRAGYRHAAVPSYHLGEQELELVGDWSAIPAERHGFHEIWGLAWDMASLAVDESAEPINGDRPHVAPGPRLFVADSQNSRVCLLSFKHNAHDEPAVTEFLTGIADPWDLVCVDGVLYVSERQAHRVRAYDATTGALIRTVVSGAALAAVNSERVMVRTASLATVRAEPCVAPEGLAHQDGWLYYGAKANEQVRRVNLTSGLVEVVCQPIFDNNSKFAKITLSDGTFGPRGTVFSCTWSNALFGMPQAQLPDTGPAGSTWWYYGNDKVSRGKGGNWEALGYACGVGVGSGRLFAGSSQEGLAQISKALPTDTLVNVATYKAGAAQFVERGHTLLHGYHGFGHLGYALPWGETPEMDYYLGWNGHTQ
jgi:hypothetical protein